MVGERGRVRRRRDDKASRESRLKRTAVGVVVGGVVVSAEERWVGWLCGCLYLQVVDGAERVCAGKGKVLR